MYYHNEKKVDKKDKDNSMFNYEKEMRLLAKRSALKMPSMQNRLRDIIYESFKRIDFYDADLVQEMKRYKLVK